MFEVCSTQLGSSYTDKNYFTISYFNFRHLTQITLVTPIKAMGIRLTSINPVLLWLESMCFSWWNVQ